jgi:outer membrane protein TolC
LVSKFVPPSKHDTRASYHDNYGLRIEYPEVAECETPTSLKAEQTIQPLSFEDPADLPAIDLTLQEAINYGLTNSPILRTIGAASGAQLVNVGTPTVYDPGIIASSNGGTEAALAAFDAQYQQQLFWLNADVPANQVGDVFGQPNAFQSKSAVFNAGLSKTTATGASFALRHVVNYDRNNRFQGFRAFSSTFTGWLEAEWRQPLLQGSGTTYNLIAGPNAVPGQYNGVWIARINEDVSLADFENSVIQLVSDVETAYWDLVTAYRVLDTAVKAREAALQTWQIQKARLDVGSGRADDEAQARSQYYQFDFQVKDSLAGVAGLYDAEQRLRYLIGFVATDGRLIRPTTDPTDVRVVFDWESALSQALERRVEIRRLRLAVRRRELELMAARLNYRPRLDWLSQYRYRGLGNHLIGGGDGNLDNLYAELSNGDFQEWQTGIELTFPVGFRAAGVAIANARLNVRRERALLAESEYLASHDLSRAAREIEKTHELMETNYNRLISDLNQVDVLRIRYEQGSDSINFLLQAQRQVVSSATDFYRSLSNYNLAIRDFHREKGSLLAYNHVQLGEGPWASGAEYDAYQTGRFLHPRVQPDQVLAPRPITSGPFDPSAVQDTSGVIRGDAVDSSDDSGADSVMVPLQDDASGLIAPEQTTEPVPPAPNIPNVDTP